MSSVQEGWYPDPSGDLSQARYWDGEQWTDRRMPIDPAITKSVESQATTINSTDQTLRLIAFILNVLTCVGVAILLIPLAWAIPMTVYSWGIYKGKKSNSTAFGVCTLLFVNLISGILLLVSKKDA